jgi:hypothetical protein
MLCSITALLPRVGNHFLNLRAAAAPEAHLLCCYYCYCCCRYSCCSCCSFQLHSMCHRAVATVEQQLFHNAALQQLFAQLFSTMLTSLLLLLRCCCKYHLDQQDIICIAFACNCKPYLCSDIVIASNLTKIIARPLPVAAVQLKCSVSARKHHCIETSWKSTQIKVLINKRRSNAAHKAASA